MATKKAARTIERAVAQMMRSMGRHNVGHGTEKALKKLMNVSHLAVIDCLDECEDDGTRATVGMIARRAGADPSRASRMVMNAVRAGYVERVISQDDARRTYVALTLKGKKFAAGIRQIRRKHFVMRLRGWSEEDCETFAHLLTRFARGERQQRQHTGRRSAKELPPALGKDTSVVLHPILRRRAHG
jgi:DNA-binding MarR family transcriptional regulator